MLSGNYHPPLSKGLGDDFAFYDGGAHRTREVSGAPPQNNNEQATSLRLPLPGASA